jgi:tetratricopeptide (TPR) repeat protein
MTHSARFSKIILISVFAFIGSVFPSLSFSQNATAIDLYEQGKKAQDLELYQDAIELYKSSLVKNSHFAGPLVGLAQSYYFLEEYKEALQYVTEARKYEKNNLAIDTLEGLIQTGLQAFDKARERFQYVLGKEPNNLDARFGLAGLDIANGMTKQAAKKYIDTLAVSPFNKPALLALVRIYSGMGDYDAASSYLELATKYYSNDSAVHFEAGKFYDANKNDKLAQFHYKTALDLKPNYYEAMITLGVLDYKQGSTNDAIELAKKAIASQSNDVKYMGRYLLGLFYAKNGNVSDSSKNFIASLRIRNDDEISRITAETLVASKLPETDSLRRDLALYHFKNGKLYEKDSYLSMALNEYRRALQIDPHYEDARFAYGHILKIEGFPLDYLFNLKLLRDYYHNKDTRVLDDYEIELKKYDDSVSHDWQTQLIDATGTDSTPALPNLPDAQDQSKSANDRKLFNQFTIHKNQFVFALYTNPSKNGLMHFEADKALIAYFKDILSRSDKLTFQTDDSNHDQSREFEYVSSPANASRLALDAHADYFIMCKFQELERSFEINATVYLARTGSEIKTFNVYKTGNNKVSSAMAKCAEDIEAALPLKGSIILREFNNGIIDIGRLQGAKNGDSLIIVKKGGLTPDNRSLALGYNDKDVIGNIKITQVDENISLGTIEKSGMYDFINPHDEVVYAITPDDKKQIQQQKK